METIVSTRYEFHPDQFIIQLEATVSYCREAVTQLFEVLEVERPGLSEPSYFRRALDRLDSLREDFAALLAGEGDMPQLSDVEILFDHHTRLAAYVRGSGASTLGELWRRADDPWVLLALIDLHPPGSSAIDPLRRYGSRMFSWRTGDSNFEELVCDYVRGGGVELARLGLFAAEVREQHQRDVREAEADGSVDPTFLYLDSHNISLMETLSKISLGVSELASHIMRMADGAIKYGLRERHEDDSDASLSDATARAANLLRADLSEYNSL